MKHYDYVLVGSGLYAGVFTWHAGKNKKTYLVLGKRDHIGGSIYCKDVEGVHVHKCDTHTFYTNNRKMWGFVNGLAEFSRYTNSPVANFKGGMYSMSSNMDTFGRMQSISTPDEAKAVIEKQRAEMKEGPKDLEEQAISLARRELYEKLIKGYTEKQWDRDCRELPTFIIKRIPVRHTCNDNYFNDLYQGIPVGEYNIIIGKLLEGCNIETGADYLGNKEYYDGLGEAVVYTGTIDAFYGYRFGRLEYRSLRFGSQTLEEENHQDIAVINHADRETPYTGVIEHRHLKFGSQSKTVIAGGYPTSWQERMEPYYPVNGQRSQELFYHYEKLVKAGEHVQFDDRPGGYKCCDTDEVIESAMRRVEEIFGR